MSNWKVLVGSALFLLTSGISALADCRIAGAESLPDGTWLVSLNGNWKPVSELNGLVADGRAHDVNFTYVAREPDPTIPRRGILVIKTGVRAPDAVGKVALAREAYQPVDQCESYPRFPGGSVRARSYDDYHDYSYSVEKSDQKTIEAFHVSYPKRGQGCSRSNDDTTDSYFTGRWQSNRSQFSFDEDVVATGQHSQFLAQARFFIGPAYAGTGLSERRVEIKRYVADKNGLACVPFSVALKQGSFVRINDLERRDGLFRAPEQSWEWPR